MPGCNCELDKGGRDLKSPLWTPHWNQSWDSQVTEQHWGPGCHQTKWIYAIDK